MLQFRRTITLIQPSILFITGGFPRTRTDYIARFLLDFAQHLKKSGYTVTVLAPMEGNNLLYEEWDGLKVYRFPYFFPRRWMRLAYGNGMIYNIKKNIFLVFQIPFFFLFELFYGLKIARKENISIVHAHWLVPQGLVSTLIHLFYPVKVIITVHGSDLRITPSFFSKIILSRADAVISPHPELTRILHSYPIPHVREIPNIIDESFFFPETVTSGLCDDLKITTKYVVTFVARLNDFKDPVTFIKAVPHIISREPDVTFLIAGDGPRMRDIEHLVAELNIRDCVRILGYRDDINSILKISTIFTALSPVENIWSLTIIEALAMGIPCIVTNSGLTSEYLQNSIDAVLIPPEDPEKLADEVINLLHNEVVRKSLSLNGKILVDTKFSSSSIIQKYDDLIGSL